MAKPKRIRLEKYVDPSSSALGIGTGAERLVSCADDAKAGEVLSVMLNRGVRRVLVNGKKTGHFRGIISTTDMLDFLGAGERHAEYRKKAVMLNARVSDIMETRVHALDSSRSVADAIALMRKRGVGGLPITRGKKLAGFISESDIVNRITGRLKPRVGEVMRNKPFFVREKYTVFEVAKIMVHGPYRRLPVVSDGILTGMATPYDILRHLNDSKKLRGGLPRDNLPIRAAMNPNAIYAKPQNRLHTAVGVMQRHRVGGLPVVNGDEMDITGIITESDVVGLLE